jgi:hypothetical protein
MPMPIQTSSQKKKLFQKHFSVQVFKEETSATGFSMKTRLQYLLILGAGSLSVQELNLGRCIGAEFRSQARELLKGLSLGVESVCCSRD